MAGRALTRNGFIQKILQREDWGNLMRNPGAGKGSSKKNESEIVWLRIEVNEKVPVMQTGDSKENI